MKRKNLVGLMSLAMAVAVVSCSPAPQSNEAAANEENLVVKTIMERRSIRKYQDKPVSRDTLQLLLECGINAPSAMNRQQWQVRVVDDAEYINGITAVYLEANPKAGEDPNFKNLYRNAPVVIFVASPKSGEAQFDCGLLSENIMLAAQSMGLGTCCLGSPVRFMKKNKEAAPYVEKLQLPDDYELLYAIAVGYPDESPAAKPRDMGKAKFID